MLKDTKAFRADEAERGSMRDNNMSSGRLKSRVSVSIYDSEGFVTYEKSTFDVNYYAGRYTRCVFEPDGLQCAGARVTSEMRKAACSRCMWCTQQA